MSEETSSKFFALTVPKQNLNQFFNVVQFLSKIGKEVMIEVDNDTTVFRTLNDAKSAFASVEFGNDYFETFSLTVPSDEVFTCKLPIKPLCVILKNVKIMQYLKIHNSIKDDVEHELVFSMQCDHGIRRTHRFIYQDSDIVSAMFDESSSSCLQCQPKVLSELFAHIHSKWSEEIAFDIGPRSFRLRTFHHDGGGSNSSSGRAAHTPVLGRAHMSSEMCIDPSSEFDVYDFKMSESQEIVVCCKELRALLWLCEIAEVSDLSFFLTEAGRPVKLGFEIPSLSNRMGGGGLTVNLVMATLEPHNAQGQNGYSQSQQPDEDNAVVPQSQQLPDNNDEAGGDSAGHQQYTSPWQRAAITDGSLDGGENSGVEGGYSGREGGGGRSDSKSSRASHVSGSQEERRGGSSHRGGHVLDEKEDGDGQDSEGVAGYNNSMSDDESLSPEIVVKTGRSSTSSASSSAVGGRGYGGDGRGVEGIDGRRGSERVSKTMRNDHHVDAASSSSYAANHTRSSSPRHSDINASSSSRARRIIVDDDDDDDEYD